MRFHVHKWANIAHLTREVGAFFGKIGEETLLLQQCRYCPTYKVERFDGAWDRECFGKPVGEGQLIEVTA